MKICIDTDILIGTGFSSIEDLRDEFTDIMNADRLLTKWQYIFFTEHELRVAPLCVWEYLSVKNRKKDFKQSLELTNALISRFNAETKLDKMTWILGILLGSVTGASCDDAYVYIYSIEEKFDYCASNNKKDLEPILNYTKETIIKKMRYLVETFEISDNVRDTVQIKKNVFTRIDNLATLRWPELIFSAADIPT